MKRDLPVFERGTQRYLGILYGVEWPQHAGQMRLVRRTKPRVAPAYGADMPSPGSSVDWITVSATVDRNGDFNGVAVDAGTDMEGVANFNHRLECLPSAMEYPYRYMRAQGHVLSARDVEDICDAQAAEFVLGCFVGLAVGVAGMGLLWWIF